MTNEETALLSREFPDFDQATLPEIPEGFVCAAWHNDALPFWYEGGDAVKEGQLVLAIDFADESFREYPGTKRFTLGIGSLDDPNHVPLVSTDDWRLIEAWVRMARLIRDKLGLGFHPDTRGRDYVEDGTGGVRSFTDEEAASYDADINTICEAGDIYEPAFAIWRGMGLLAAHEG